jgi:hypothetical protein
MFAPDLQQALVTPPAYVVAYAQSANQQPFMLAAGGIDLNDEEATNQKASSRIGHAAFTAGELKNEVAALAADQRKEYKHVRDLLAKFAPAQAQLDALVVKHRLKYKDIKGHTVLDNLELIASKPTVHAIDASALARDLVQDICRPSTIDQAAHSTCTATSIQAALARNNPGEYARFVAGVGTGSGDVATRDGHFHLTSHDYLNFKDRSVSSNLMQPAIMELEAQNEGGHYTNKTDKIHPAKGAAHSGAYDDDVAAVASALMGTPYKVLTVKAGNHDQVLALLGKASPKEPLIVGVTVAGGGGHEMQVVGYKAGKKRVIFRNPWGLVQETDFDTFVKSTDGLVYKAN